MAKVRRRDQQGLFKKRLPKRWKYARFFSFGGGVQSTAVLVLQAQGKLKRPYDAFIFSNVGEDSENPETLDYIHNHAIPYAVQHGITIITVQKIRRNGKPETLREYIYRTERSVPIPARMSNGAPGNRSCTLDFKIRPVDAYIRPLKKTHVVVGLGISLDEFRRMKDEHWHWEGGKTTGLFKRREHPLIDLRLNRSDCHRIIQSAGLPTTPKSSCYFCPFKRRNEWVAMRRNRADLFWKSVELEEHINEKRAAMEPDRVYLHSSCKPLKQAVGDQAMLPGFDDAVDTCDSGYCFT